MIFYFNQTAFEAYVTVTWTSGGTCTISNGNLSYVAPNTSGSYTFTVEEEGTWTATVIFSGQTFSASTSITESGQTKTINVNCQLELYTQGNSPKSPWNITGNGSRYVEWTSYGIDIKVTGYESYGMVYTDSLNLSGYKTLQIVVSVDENTLNNVDARTWIGVANGTPSLDSSWPTYPSNAIAEIRKPNVGTHNIDITSVSSGVIGLVASGCNGRTPRIVVTTVVLYP